MNDEEEANELGLRRVSIIALPLDGIERDALTNATWHLTRHHGIPFTRIALASSYTGIPCEFTGETFAEHKRVCKRAMRRCEILLEGAYPHVKRIKLLTPVARQSHFEEMVRMTCCDTDDPEDHVIFVVPVDVLQRFYKGVQPGMALSGSFHPDQVGYEGFKDTEVFAYAS